MADIIVWSTNSILDIISDEQVGASSASRTGDIITIDNSSSNPGFIEYRKTFNTSDNALKTSALLLSIYASSSDIAMSTRYTRHFVIRVAIRYWEHDKETDTYTPGEWDECEVYPYFSSESSISGGLGSNTQLDIRDEYIHTLRISFIGYNLGEYRITIVSPYVYSELSFEEAVQKYSGGGSGGIGCCKELKTVDTYDNGIVAYYIDSDKPVVLKVKTISNTQYEVNVSDKYTFIVTENSGNIPN